MDHFTYRDAVLHAEDVPVPLIAEAVGTPFYCYSNATMTRHYRVLSEALDGSGALICYAVKANSNQSVIATFAGLGAGADVISGGELMRVRAAGVPADKIVFAGPGKSPEELVMGLDADILQFNVESEQELRLLSELAAARGQTARVALRVNPDVDARTHEKITTGRKQNKFGIPYDRALEVYRLGCDLPGLDMIGLALHIGSQLTDLEPFEAAFDKAGTLLAALRDAGLAVKRLNLGGGLGIPYTDVEPPSPADYGAMVKRVTGNFGVGLIVEPGRMLVGNAGILVARVLYDKHEGKRFVIVDAAMNDLIRPSLYDGWHRIVPVREPAPDAPLETAEVVGPICESGDFLGHERPLPAFAPDDLIAVRTAGAYGAVMSSTYNSRPLVPEVLVNGSEFAVVRPRPSPEALIGLDRTAPWLARD